MGLAAEMPAEVFGDLLGISIDTAVHWNHEASNTRFGHTAETIKRRPRHAGT